MQITSIYHSSGPLLLLGGILAVLGFYSRLCDQMLFLVVPGWPYMLLVIVLRLITYKACVLPSLLSLQSLPIAFHSYLARPISTYFYSYVKKNHIYFLGAKKETVTSPTSTPSLSDKTMWKDALLIREEQKAWTKLS